MTKKKNQENAKVEGIAAPEIAPGQVTLEEAISAAEKGGATEALIGSFKKVQEALSEQEARNLLLMAQSDSFAYYSRWMNYLPGLTRREVYVLAVIYGFQRSGGEYRMSHGRAAVHMRLADGATVRAILRKLLELGYVLKLSNGTRKPATYRVAEITCIQAAAANGWEPTMVPNKTTS